MSWNNRAGQQEASGAVREAPAQPDEMLQQIRLLPQGWYALLDACDEPRVPLLVKQLGKRAVSLYRGYAELDYADLAPYLVQVDERLLKWIVQEFSGDPWGVLLRSEAELHALRRHFRQFLLVRGPDSEPFYFRFYDPRVLPLFLSSAEPERAAKFFGPVSMFYIEDEDQQWRQLSRREAAAGGDALKSRGALQFSEADLAALGQARLGRFRQRLAAHLAQMLDERQRPMGHDQLMWQIDEGLRRSRFYQLQRQCDVARYLEIMCVELGGLSPRADPLDAQNLLLDRRVAAAERLQNLAQWAARRGRTSG